MNILYVTYFPEYVECKVIAQVDCAITTRNMTDCCRLRTPIDDVLHRDEPYFLEIVMNLEAGCRWLK